MDYDKIYGIVGVLLGLLIAFTKQQVLAQIMGAANWFVMGWVQKRFAAPTLALLTLVRETAVRAASHVWHRFLKFEIAVMNVIASATQSPHWTFFWLMFAVVWVLWRQLGSHSWYTDALDLLVITIFWSIKPAIVEYSLKYSQGIQLKEQAKNTELLISLLNLNLEMGRRIFKTVEFTASELAEQDNEKSAPSSTE